MSAKRRNRAAGAVLALAVLAASGPAGAGPHDPGAQRCDATCGADLDRARAATERYWDSTVAARDGFVEQGGCSPSPAGTLGIQWAHPARISDQAVDVEEPESLLYMPQGNAGGRRLIGLEYSAPARDGGPAPELFGRRFGGPVPARVPAQAEQYVLRVWLFTENPDGLFADANPAEACVADELVDRHGAAEDCLEVMGTISAPEERVRPLVPERFSLQPGGSSGTVRVNVGTHRCERAILPDGPTGPVMFGHYTAFLQPPDYAGVDLGDSRYLFRMAFDSREVAQWARAGTGVGHDVFSYSSDIERHFDPGGGIVDPTYRFSTPDFVLDASVADAKPAESPFTVRFFRETPGGTTASFRVWVRGILLPAIVTVTPKPGSLLAEIVGCPADAASCAPVSADDAFLVRLDTTYRLTRR